MHEDLITHTSDRSKNRRTRGKRRGQSRERRVSFDVLLPKTVVAKSPSQLRILLLDLQHCSFQRCDCKQEEGELFRPSRPETKVASIRARSSQLTSSSNRNGILPRDFVNARKTRGSVTKTERFFELRRKSQLRNGDATRHDAEVNSPSRQIRWDLKVRFPPPSTGGVGSFNSQTRDRSARGREEPQRTRRRTDNSEIRRFELRDVGFVGY